MKTMQSDGHGPVTDTNEILRDGTAVCLVSKDSTGGGLPGS